MKNNLFDNIPANLDNEIFETLIKTQEIKIERIISRGHHSPEHGWYDQENSEWVMVLKGKAILMFEDGSEFILKQGDYLNIPAHKKHKVIWTDINKETIWLAIHY